MDTTRKTSKGMHLALWIAQALLAATFTWAGCMKLFQPGDLPFPWVKGKPGLVVFTGIMDVLAGFGIVLPALLRIKAGLTVFTAYGIIVLMLAASMFHISRGEAKDIGFNLFMLLLAAFVAWGRQKKAPIANK